MAISKKRTGTKIHPKRTPVHFDLRIFFKWVGKKTQFLRIFILLGDASQAKKMELPEVGAGEKRCGWKVPAAPRTIELDEMSVWL